MTPLTGTLKWERAATLSSCGGLPRTRVELSLFPSDDGKYRFGAWPPEECCGWRDLPFCRPWKKNWVPLLLSTEGKILPIWLDVASTAQRLQVTAQELLQGDPSDFLRRKRMTTLLPFLTEGEVQAISRAAQSWPALPAVPENSHISRWEWRGKSLWVTIPQLEIVDGRPQLVEQRWNYTQGGFERPGNPRSVIDWMRSLSLEQWKASVLFDVEGTGLSFGDRSQILATVRERYLAGYQGEQPMILPSKTACQIVFGRDGTVRVNWERFDINGDQISIHQWTHEIFTERQEMREVCVGQSYRDKAQHVLLTQSRFMEQKFVSSCALLGLDEPTARQCAQFIWRQYATMQVGAAVLGHPKLRGQVQPGGSVLIHTRHVVFDAQAQAQHICEACGRCWDYFANHYVGSIAPWISFGDIVRKNRDIDAALYESFTRRALFLEVSVTAHRRETRLPRNLVFTLQGRVYEKVKDMGRERGSFRKKKEALDPISGKMYARLVAKNPSQEEQQQMHREFEVLSRLKGCRGIVSVEELVIASNRKGDPTWTLIEQNCQRGELFAVINDRGPLPLAEQKAIISDLLEGLKAIHEHSCVHSDIKVENIFLDASSDKTPIQAYIGDCNLSRSFERETDEVPTLSGAPHYVSPEKARAICNQKLKWTYKDEKAADVWAMGLVLFLVYEEHRNQWGELTDVSFRRLATRTTRDFFPHPSPPHTIAFLVEQMLQPADRRLTSAQALDLWKEIEKRL